MHNTPNFSRKIFLGRSAFKSERNVSEIYLFENDKDLTLQIFKEIPGKGFRHFLSKKDVIKFIDLLPEWQILSRGLDSVVLAKGEAGCDGFYNGSSIALCAWERDLWRRVPPDYYQCHSHIFSRLMIECCKEGKEYLCKFTPETIRGFQLLHVFLHELGHHYDRITTKRKLVSSRGEDYAEGYAFKYESIIWKRYLDNFAV
jgi:hypothetical protein